MAGDDDSIGVTIKAKIALVVRRVPKKHAQGGSRSKFISGGGGKVWVALTTKDTQVVVRGLFPEEREVRHGEIECLSGKNVQQICGSAEGGCPKPGGNASLKKKRANDIIDGSNDAFGFTMLRRGVWTGHAQTNAVGEEEDARTGVIKLRAIIALNTLHSNIELGAHISEKVR